MAEKKLTAAEISEAPPVFEMEAKNLEVKKAKAAARKEQSKKNLAKGTKMAPSTWTAEEKIKCQELYIRGCTMAELSKELSRPVKAIRSYINTVLRSLTNTKQSRMLPMMSKFGKLKIEVHDAHAKEYNYLRNPELINEEFFKLLSPPDSVDLTEEEEKFCWCYASSLDLEESIYASGLDAGLYTVEKCAEDGTRNPVKGFESCIKMRIAYLKAKPNLAAFVKKIREDAVFTVNVGKDFLQQEILLQIEALKGSQTLESKKLLRDYIMMLGKTFGGFVDTVQVEEIDHAKTIERLLDASKRNRSKDLNAEARRAEAALAESQAIRDAAERKLNEAKLRFSSDGSTVQ